MGKVPFNGVATVFGLAGVALTSEVLTASQRHFFAECDGEHIHKLARAEKWRSSGKK